MKWFRAGICNHDLSTWLRWCLIFMFSVLASSEVFAQHVIHVDPSRIVKTLTHNPSGINIDYIVDDDSLHSSGITLAESLKKLGVGVLRFPGGEKSDNYLWSVSPWKTSSPHLLHDVSGPGSRADAMKINPQGKIISPTLDFDEFMKLCQDAQAKPVVVVPYDVYYASSDTLHSYVGKRINSLDELVQNAEEWVRYARDKKYPVTYWMIGNESWNSLSNFVSPEQYAKDIAVFSKRMKAVDPSIRIVANGHYSWYWQKLLTGASEFMDDICVSNYPLYHVKNGFNGYQQGDFKLVDLVEKADSAILHFAVPHKRKSMGIIVAEYNAIDWGKDWKDKNDLGHALGVLDIFLAQLQHPRVTFSCFWNTRWINNAKSKHEVYDALDWQNELNANGKALSLWGNFHGDVLVDSNSDDPLLKISTSINQDKGIVYLCVINKSNDPAQVSVSVKGSKRYVARALHTLSGTGDEDVSPQLTHQVLNSKDTILLKGVSINVIELSRSNP